MTDRPYRDAVVNRMLLDQGSSRKSLIASGFRVYRCLYRTRRGHEGMVHFGAREGFVGARGEFRRITGCRTAKIISLEEAL